jgi:hypothetical protein
MKKFLRVLPPLFLLLLVAIAWPYASETGVARNNASATQKRLPPGSPEILSFTANPARVLKGEPATLSWRVSNAKHIWIASGDRPDAAECIKQEFGEMRVTPDGDTTYTLHVWSGGMEVSQPVSVQVGQPTGFCSISGTISRDKPEYATTVDLYLGDSTKPLLSTRVDSNGFYKFSNVLEGTYQVVPKGRYPVDRFSIGPNPRSQRVSCQPNGSHRADFTIRSNEG